MNSAQYIFLIISCYLLSFEAIICDQAKVESNEVKTKSPTYISTTVNDSGSVIYYDEWGNYNLIINEKYTPIESNFKYIEVVAQTHNKKFIYLIEKSDSITITQIDNDFIGKSERKSEIEFNFYKSYVIDNNIGKEIILPDMKIDLKNLSQELVNKEKKIKNNLANQLKYLSIFQKENNLSIDFYNVWKDYFVNRMLEEKLFIIPNTLAISQLPEWYQNELTNTIKCFHRDDLLYLREYQSSSRLASYYQQLLKSKFNKPSENVAFNTINEFFSGYTKEYLLTALYNSVKRESQSKNSDKIALLNNIAKNIQSNVYEIYDTNRKDVISLKNKDLADIEKNGYSFSEIYSHDKKITYIDIWASWCGPCRVEMKSSVTLKKEYTSRGISFSYISIDEDLSAWEKASKQIGLSTKNSFIIPDIHNSSIINRFKIKEIPRYILLDNNGNILDENAPRPSDLNIRQYLDNALNK